MSGEHQDSGTHKVVKETGLRSGIRLRAGLSLCGLVVLLEGCGSQATLITETQKGGSVQYSFTKEQDILASSGRHDAVKIMTEKCPAGYRVTHEGAVSRINPALDKAWNGQIPSEKLWVMQFECKS